MGGHPVRRDERRVIPRESEGGSRAGYPAVDDDRPRWVTADEMGASEHKLIGTLLDIIEDARRGTPVFNRDGDHIDNVPDHAAATRAVELLMKHRGMLRDQHDHHHQGTVRVEIVGVNPEAMR